MSRIDTYHRTSDFSAKHRGLSQARQDKDLPASSSHHDRNNRSFNFEARDSRERDWHRSKAAPTPYLLAARPDTTALFRTAGAEPGLGLRAAPRTAGLAPSREEEPGPEDDYLLRQLIAEKNSVKRRVQHTLAEIPAMERRLDHCAQIFDTLQDEQIKQLLHRL